MAWRFFLQFVCFMLFCVFSKELPVDSLENSDTSDQRNSKNDFITVESFDFFPQTEVPKHPIIQRLNHARMLQTTTESYEEWWYITTGRRIINHKDYPGVTGEGSWKEISPIAVKQKSLLKKPPSSSEVASSSWKLEVHHVLFLSIPCTLLFFRNT